MSQPPGEQPEEQPGNGVPPGQYPQYPQNPQYPPQYGYPPQQPMPNPKSVSVGGVIGGVFLFPILNFGIGLVTVMLAAQSKSMLAVGVAVLALVTFGGGIALWKTNSPTNKGLGLGLMIGWALTSILTVGYCTGLNPYLYA